VQPERAPTESPDIGYLVMQWKDRPDPHEPWWVHWYYNRVYIPFQRFSFKWFRIPRAKQATVTADEKGRTTTTFSFFENGGFFDDADCADLACVDEQDGYKPMYRNRRIPKESAEIGGPVFPRSKKPARWARPTMSLVVKDRKRDEQMNKQWQECLAQLNRELDRR
jgi:hypothetical protein